PDAGDFENEFSEPGKQHVFQINLEAGAYYSFSVDHPGMQTPLELTLLNQAGTPASRTDQQDTFDWQSRESTSYFLRIAPMDALETGKYELHIRKWSDDYPESEPAKISVGETVSGGIQFEQDWDSFWFTGKTGRKYHLTLHFP